MGKVGKISNKMLFIATVENHLISFYIPFMKYLQSEGYEIHIATKLGEKEEEFKKQEIVCHNVDFSRSVNSFSALMSLRQLIGLMRKNDFTLIHVHTPIAAFLGRLTSKLAQTRPVLYTAHGFIFIRVHLGIIGLLFTQLNILQQDGPMVLL